MRKMIALALTLTLLLTACTITFEPPRGVDITIVPRVTYTDCFRYADGSWWCWDGYGWYR